MRVKTLLADSAEVREGLLFLLGGGWKQVGPQPQPFAIAGMIEVEWNETNSRHRIEFVIEDEDGSPFLVPTPTGDQPFRLGREFDVGRPPGSTQGETFNVPIAVPIIPLPWTPGRRYVVRTLIDGNDVDRLTFQVGAAAPGR